MSGGFQLILCFMELGPEAEHYSGEKGFCWTVDGAPHYWSLVPLQGLIEDYTYLIVPARTCCIFLFPLSIYSSFIYSLKYNSAEHHYTCWFQQYVESWSNSSAVTACFTPKLLELQSFHLSIAETVIRTNEKLFIIPE